MLVPLAAKLTRSLPPPATYFYCRLLLLTSSPAACGLHLLPTLPPPPRAQPTAGPSGADWTTDRPPRQQRPTDRARFQGAPPPPRPRPPKHPYSTANPTPGIVLGANLSAVGNFLAVLSYVQSRVPVLANPADSTCPCVKPGTDAFRDVRGDGNAIGAVDYTPRAAAVLHRPESPLVARPRLVAVSLAARLPPRPALWDYAPETAIASPPSAPPAPAPTPTPTTSTTSTTSTASTASTSTLAHGLRNHAARANGPRRHPPRLSASAPRMLVLRWKQLLFSKRSRDF